jgi:hypothetical protein
MARRSTTVKEPRTANYREKQTLLRVGRAQGVPAAVGAATEAVNVQVNNWLQGFGQFHRAWVVISDKVLAPALASGTITKFNYALYKAFLGEYISKVQMKGTETDDMVKTKFTRLGADSGLLDSITTTISTGTT